MIAEPGADEVRRLWLDAEQVSCVSIGYVEARATIGRRLRGRLSGRARRTLDHYWQGIETVVVDDLLIAFAARIAEEYRLRGLDALHLAAATQAAEGGLVFATWDAELARAAGAAGLPVVP